MSNEKELDCVIGTVGLGKAPWLSELVKPSFQLQPSNYNKPRLTMDNACIGKDIYSRIVSISAEKSAYFSRVHPFAHHPLSVFKGTCKR
jgi:hypothetical protein